jgi:NADH-quinone oxidoreductase subunit A
MTAWVAYLLLFIAVGVGFIFVHLIAGRFFRPVRPDPEKSTIYECGEPTIGSAWVQFDLRFYVVALLFVIFDVEVAFFFPWAVVYGKLTQLSRNIPDAERAALTVQLTAGPNARPAEQEKQVAALTERFRNYDVEPERNQRAAARLARIAFLDILVFFGVLLVGFAYLWRRGDLNWVRSVAAEQGQMTDLTPTAPEPPARLKPTDTTVIIAVQPTAHSH